MLKGIISFKNTHTPLWTASLLSRWIKLHPCIVTIESGMCFYSQISVMQTRAKSALSTTCANSSIFGARDITLKEIAIKERLILLETCVRLTRSNTHTVWRIMRATKLRFNWVFMDLIAECPCCNDLYGMVTILLSRATVKWWLVHLTKPSSV